MRPAAAVLAGAALLGLSLGCQHFLTRATVLMDCQFVGMMNDAQGASRRGYLCDDGIILAVPVLPAAHRGDIEVRGFYDFYVTYVTPDTGV